MYELHNTNDSSENEYKEYTAQYNRNITQ